MGQELLNAAILMVAVVMLSWHLLWMKRHAASITTEIKQMGEALNSGDKEPFILAIIVGLAILREGSEAVIFLYGLAAAGSSAGELITGAGMGLLAGIISGTLLYLGIARIPTGRLFQISGWMLLLLTAGLATQASSYLVQADLLPALGYSIWDSSFLLPQHSLLGQVLHILVGYVENPMGIQLLTYLLTVALIGTAMYRIERAAQRA
jgi:high-affinity iron transporter